MSNRLISKLTGAPITIEEANELTHLEFEVRLNTPWRDNIAIHIRGINPHLDPTGQTKYIATGLKIATYPIPAEVPVAFSLSTEAATELMGQLWSLGIRPAERHLPTPATLGAVNSHLEDMRKLAFDLINKLVLKK